MVEGKNLISDALNAGVIPQYIFFSDPKSLINLIPSGFGGYKNPSAVLKKLPLYRAPYKKLKLWSDMTNCPGLTGNSYIKCICICLSIDRFLIMKNIFNICG